MKCSIFLLIFNVLLPTEVRASCLLKLIPMMERVKKADIILSGTILEGSPLEKKTEVSTHKIKVKVKEVYKGEFGAPTIEIFFKASKPRECDAKTISFPIGKKTANRKERLFYLKKLGAAFFTSSEWGGGPANYESIKRELEMYIDFPKDNSEAE